MWVIGLIGFKSATSFYGFVYLFVVLVHVAWAKNTCGDTDGCAGPGSGAVIGVLE